MKLLTSLLCVLAHCGHLLHAVRKRLQMPNVVEQRQTLDSNRDLHSFHEGVGSLCQSWSRVPLKPLKAFSSILLSLNPGSAFSALNLHHLGTRCRQGNRISVHLPPQQQTVMGMHEDTASSQLSWQSFGHEALPRRSVLAAGLGAAVGLPQPTKGATSPLPRIGLGSCCDDYETSLATVREGLNAGYRLVDTAAHYESELAVGAALAEARSSSLKDEIRTVTKIWFDDMGYEPALASAKRSLKNLQVDQLDVLLIHFPGTIDAVQSPARNRQLRADTWRALEKFLDDGYCRSIGLSNYNRRHLRETLKSCTIVPQVLQTELHPRFQQRELIEVARSAGIQTIMAHCPLAHGSPALLQDPTLRKLSEARGDGTTPAMLCLRWSLDNGFVPIPKASSRARLDENLRVLKMMPLSAEERAAIDALDVGDRVSFNTDLIA